MLHYPHFDPVAVTIGPLKVHWYGLMYLIGFLSAYCLGVYRAKRSNGRWSAEQVSDMIFYSAVGLILGGRIGYMLFYNFPTLIHRPWETFYVWDGGMSFHGGVLGFLAAMLILSHQWKKSLWDVTDFLVPLVPIGLGAGRFGNFINGELWGRITDVPWAMVFPRAGAAPRHPSQLYEMFMEGVVLFIILWCYSMKSRPRMAVSALFILCYGCFRFVLEFFRQPDPQLKFIAFNWLTMGQLLSIPMILIGVTVLFCVYYRR
jgi:phosphatidylglycerol---prolipoprotein diacylglyceryl transferase